MSAPAAAASTPAVRSSWPVDWPSASVMVTPPNRSLPAQQAADDRAREGGHGAAVVIGRKSGHRHHHRVEPVRDHRLVRLQRGRALRRRWGAARRACCRCRSARNPGRGSAWRWRPRRVTADPRANAVAYVAVVPALNEKARPCCQMNAPREGGHVGDRREVHVDPVALAAGCPVARPCDGCGRDVAGARHLGRGQVGGPLEIRLTSPPSWSMAISSRGLPPARAARCSAPVSATRLATRDTMLLANRITEPTSPWRTARSSEALGGGAGEADHDPLAEQLRRGSRHWNRRGAGALGAGVAAPPPEGAAAVEAVADDRVAAVAALETVAAPAPPASVEWRRVCASMPVTPATASRRATTRRTTPRPPRRRSPRPSTRASRTPGWGTAARCRSPRRPAPARRSGAPGRRPAWA